MMSNVTPELSKRIVTMLVEDGQALGVIAKDAGTTVAFLKKVLAGGAALKPAHLDRLDDLHPDLPFRIGSAVVRDELKGLAKKAGNVAGRVKAKGDGVVESVGRGLRKGAWKLLNSVYGGGEET